MSFPAAVRTPSWRSKERTAAVLGISLKTLYNRLRDYAAEKAPGPNGANEPETGD